MGLLKFGLCVVTWIILCVSKTSAENNSLQSSESECVEGQDILQPGPCTKCVCEEGKIVCEDIPCEREKNATRSGPDTYPLNEKVRPPEIMFDEPRSRRFKIGNNNGITEAILPINYPTAQPQMSSIYTKDSKIIEEKGPNISMILKETREENILKTFVTPNFDSNSDKYILIVPEAAQMNEQNNFQAQSSQIISPNAFQFAPGISRPLARQPLVFGRPGDKRLLMRPRHFMRNDGLFQNRNNGMRQSPYSQQKGFTSTNFNSNWKSQHKSGSMSQPMGNNDNSAVSVYTPGQSTPFNQNNYYNNQEPVLYNNNNNNKVYVDGKVRWKLANDYNGEYQMPEYHKQNQNKGGNYNNDDECGGTSLRACKREPFEPMSDSESSPEQMAQYPPQNFNSAEMPNNQLWNPGSGENYNPGSNYPNYDQNIPMSSLGNKQNFNTAHSYSKKTKKKSPMYTDFSWHKPTQNKRPFNQAGNYYPNGATSNQFNKKKISTQKQTSMSKKKKKKPGKKQKQIMLYLDDDEEQPDQSMNNPNNKPYQNKLPPRPDYGGVPQAPGAIPPYPDKAFNIPNNILNYQPFNPNQNGPPVPNNIPYPNMSPPGQNKNIGQSNTFDYKKHKINFKNNQKPFGQINMPQLPNNIPNYMPNQNTLLPRPQIPQNRPAYNNLGQSPNNILNYQPFLNKLPPGDMFPNTKQQLGKKIKNQMSSEMISKKKRKKKKKKNKNIMLSTEDDPNPDYPGISPELAKKIKDILLSNQKRPNQNYPLPQITPELIRKIKNILLSAQKSFKKRGYPKITPELARRIRNILLLLEIPDDQDYSEITPELAKKIKDILLSIQDTPNQDYSDISPEFAKKIKDIILSNRHPSMPKNPKPNNAMPFFKIPTMFPNNKKPFSNQPNRPSNKRPQGFKNEPEMYPDLPNRYPNMPKKPGIDIPFVPVSLNNAPQMYPEYESKPMMYDYPHITEKPDDESPITPVQYNNEPQMYPDYQPNKPNKPENDYPEMYKNEPNNYPDYGDKPKGKPISERPESFYNEPEIYEDYEPTNFLQKPKKPMNENPQVPIQYDEIKPKSASTINQSPQKPKRPGSGSPIMPNSNEPENYPDYELTPIKQQFLHKPNKPVSERPLNPQEYGNQPEMYPDGEYKPKEIYSDYEPSSVSKHYSHKHKKPAIEDSIIPVALGNEPQMYPGYEPKEPNIESQIIPLNDYESQMYPDFKPKSKKPINESPIIPSNLNNDQQMYPGYNPKEPIDEGPIIPLTLDNEPQMYPGYEPKKPIAESSIIPVVYDNEPQMYPDFQPKPQRPVPESPIIPVSLDSEPQMYPNYEPYKPKKPYDIEPEIYINDAPKQLLNQFPQRPKKPISETPLMYDNEPQMYAEYVPSPKKPVDEGPIIPLSLDNEPQMYPGYKPKPNMEKPLYDIEPEIYAVNSPKPVMSSYQQRPKPAPENTGMPIAYDHEPEMYSGDESAPVMNQQVPENDNPEIMNNEPEMYPNTESIPKFNNYPSLNEEPSYNRPLQAIDGPQKQQMFNKEPEMYPNDNIPVFNHYPDKKPENFNAQAPDQPSQMYPGNEDIPVFNNYPDINKKPVDYNQQPPQAYPDYALPVMPVSGYVPENPKLNNLYPKQNEMIPSPNPLPRPQDQQPMYPLYPNRPPQQNNLEIDHRNKILNFKMLSPFNSPVATPALPNELIIPILEAQSGQKILETNKNRLSKMKYRPNPTIITTMQTKINQLPFVDEPIFNILDVNEFSDNRVTSANRNPKKSMCKLCELLDCIHPKRPLIPSIKFLDDEYDLSEIILNLLSKMSNFKSDQFTSFKPFGEDIEIILPSGMTQNIDIFKPFKSEITDYSDAEPLIMPFRWPNGPNNGMLSIFNKINSFKGKHHNNFFDTGPMQPHNMFPGGMPSVPFMPKLFNSGNGFPNFDNFMPFNKFPTPPIPFPMMSKFPTPSMPFNKFPEPSIPLPTMSKFPTPGMPMSMIEPTLPMNKLDFPPLPTNFNIPPQSEMLSDDPMENDDSGRFDKLNPSKGDKLPDIDPLNYTWQNPDAPKDQKAGPIADNTQTEPGKNNSSQDGGSIPHFDYFKSQSQSNSTSSSQVNKTNSDAVTKAGDVETTNTRSQKAQRARSKYYFNKGKRSEDQDLTYVRQSKGC